MSHLALRAVSAGYGAIPVLFDVDLHVEPGETVALLGRNGVGKTTLLRTIMSMTSLRRGQILLDGQDITGQPTHAISRLGVQFIPEDRGIFGALSVSQNLQLGHMASDIRADSGLRRALLDEFPILRERLEAPAEVLSGGERQILAVVRALLARPRLLLLDEFSEGLQPSMVHRLYQAIQQCGPPGMSIILVEQSSRFALSVSDRLYLMRKGSIVDEGPSAVFRENEGRLSRVLTLGSA